MFSCWKVSVFGDFLVRMRGKTGQKNSEHGQFSYSVFFLQGFFTVCDQITSYLRILPYLLQIFQKEIIIAESYPWYYSYSWEKVMLQSASNEEAKKVNEIVGEIKTDILFFQWMSNWCLVRTNNFVIKIFFSVQYKLSLVRTITLLSRHWQLFKCSRN